jgi:archaellum biogenesis ATPase FlaH
LNHNDHNAALGGSSNSLSPDETCSKPRAILRNLADVEEREQRWISPGRIPIGHVSGLTGDPGVGKTNMLLSLAAIVAEAEVWPDGVQGESGPVLYIDGENGEVELKRRLLAQHFTAWDNLRVMSEIYRVGDTVPFSLNLHLPLLEEAIRDFKPIWVIIDPLVAFHSNDENTAVEVRRLMSDLGRLAEQHDIAVTFIQHPNKSLQSPTLYRVRGSLDFVAAARAILRVEMSNDQRTRLLHVDKLNLGPKAAPLAFRLDDGFVEWLGLAQATAARSQRQKAVDVIRSILNYGPEEADAIFVALGHEGISKRTGERAKKDLGVRSLKDGPQGHWWWELVSTNGGSPKS